MVSSSTSQSFKQQIKNVCFILNEKHQYEFVWLDIMAGYGNTRSYLNHLKVRQDVTKLHIIIVNSLVTPGAPFTNMV